MKNLWILTEERPKANVIKTIISRVASDNGFSVEVKSGMKIIPIITDGRFSFIYTVDGVYSRQFGSVYIKIASGNSSFVDFLVFLQEVEPDQGSKPLYAIEETKTDDSESRNTGIYQRCSKFVYVEFYYPGAKKIMFYNLQIPQKEKPTKTNIFGMKMLQTIGVEVMGKIYDKETIKPFISLEELVASKNAMQLPRSVANIPIRIKVYPDRICVSGRLFKAGGIGHDPNIGALAIIALCIRKWARTKPIVITDHGLSQEHLGRDNKFIQIANRLNIKLEGLNIPIPTRHKSYWHYDTSQEKLATILLHIVLIAYTKAIVVYDNHGGSERSYFLHKKLGPIVIAKYQEGKRKKYKAGDKTMIIYIPDMIVYDPVRNEIINVEGKKYSTRKQGIKNLKNYSYIEKKVIRVAYNPDSIIRTVAVFGSQEKTIKERQIGFMLNKNGEMILGKRAPVIFREAVGKVLGL